MKKPIIAVDVDEVLSVGAQAFVDFSNTRWGTRLTINDIDEDWCKMWQVDKAEALRRSKEYHESGVISTFTAYDAALPVLEHLKNDYSLVITTSRNRLVSSETRAWLNERYPGIFDEVYFSGIFDCHSGYEDAATCTKASLHKKIGASYVIDDQPKHCIGAVGVDARAILFGNYAWNREVDLPAGVTRCDNWEEVREYFDELQGEPAVQGYGRINGRADTFGARHDIWATSSAGG